MEKLFKKYIDDILLPEYEEKYNKKYFSDRKMYTEKYSDAIVLPAKQFKGEFFPRSCVIDSNTFEPYEISKIQPDNPNLLYDFDREEVVYDDREVIFAGLFWWHWGHFLLELVSRLYYFIDDKSDIPIVYCSTTPIDGTYLEFFELLGIKKERLVWINKPTRFKKIIIPSVSVVARNWYTKEYQSIFNKVKENIAPANVKKIFFSTLKFSKNWKKDRGEIEKIEKLFLDNGYKIYYPEQLTLKRQISLLKGSEYFVSIAGTLPHNLIFANSSIKSIILNKSYLVNYHQALIDEARGALPVYVDAHLSFLPQTIGSGPFCFHFGYNLLNYAKENKFLIHKSLLSLSREDIVDYCKAWLEFYLRCLVNNNFAPHYIDFLPNNYKFYLDRLNGFCFLKMMVGLFYKIKLYQTPIVGFRRCVLIFLTKALLKLNNLVN